MRDTQAPPSEERAIYVVLALVGAVLVIAAAMAHGAADTGATFGIAFLALSLVGFGSQLRAARRVRLPTAHVRSRR